MTLKSMTGFGRAVIKSAELSVTVELSSVNRKQLDVHISVPKKFAALESRVQATVKNYLARGAITGSVDIEEKRAGNSGVICIDEAAADAAVRAIRKTAARLGLRDDLTAQTLIALPDVIRRIDPKQDTQKIWLILDRALRKALSNLVKMRHSEGTALGKDIARRLRNLSQLLERIEKRASGAAQRYAQVLKRRLKDMGIPFGDQNQRLAREIVLFAERVDISEEITRLQSHFAQAGKLLVSNKPVGRTLEFLGQEIYREINTIGSKANDASISGNVIRFKTELDAFREQIQNVE
ncbi:MAG: YicC family protein [Lentisphaerae bacterium]|nr:YicC family protein [Lentisphaerota bacterium]